MKYSLLLFSLLASIIIYAAVKYPHGIIGTTKLNGEGCACHNSESDPLVKVWLEGPDTLTIGQSAIYKLYLTGGPKVKGGYNVAAIKGTLAAIDSFSKVIDVELTHAFPQLFNSKDTISWNFNYTAANNEGIDTIYSVAMSVNGDEIPTDEDRWNFGKEFLVNVIAPVKVETEPKISLSGFELMQNYPNPFNPSTKIRYSIGVLPYSTSTKDNNEPDFVSLKVYDALGNEVAIIVSEYQPAGTYEVEFSARDGLSSGIYYYSLNFGNYSQTKKMVFMR